MYPSDQHSLAGHDHLMVFITPNVLEKLAGWRPEDVAPPEHQTSAVGTST
jgi:hypothetical protein